jgi:hypothetical protein
MEDTTKVDQQYKDGFEIAYWLRRGNSPHLQEIMDKNANGNNYDKGLQAGKKEADREQVRQRLQGNKDQSTTQDKGMDID